MGKLVADYLNITNDGGVIKDLTGNVLTDLVRQTYDTTGSTKSVSAPWANVWFDLTDLNMTVNEDGRYLLIVNVRMWQNRTSDYKWRKHRILLNNNELFVWFATNPCTSDSTLDGSSFCSYIYDFKKDDKIQIQGYIASNQSGDVYYSNSDGSSQITLIKIGE